MRFLVMRPTWALLCLLPACACGGGVVAAGDRSPDAAEASVEDVLTVAREYLHPDKLAIAIAGS